jgi:hypothetical protein
LKEEKIKSALEIAMEKISDLPELTKEEIEEQKKKEYAPVGDAVAKKFLSGTISDSQLPLELARYSESPGHIVRRSLVAAFCREIKLENEAPISDGALKGLRQLASEESDLVERMAIEFWTIIGEYSRMKEEKSQQFEVLARERLEKLGISGSSVHPNLSEDASWKEQLRKIQNSFEPQLAGIREKLLQELQ